MSLPSEGVRPAAEWSVRRWRRGGLFVVLMAAASAIGFVKNLVFAKILGAEEFGHYALVLLVVQFGIYISNWGILSALNNQLPVALGRNSEGTRELVDRALGALLVASTTTAAIYLSVILLAAQGDDDARTALVLAAAVTLVTVLSEFFILLLRVERRLVPLSSMYLLRACLAIALGALAGALWGFEGIVVTEILALATAVAISRQVWLKRVRVRAPTIRRLRWLLRWGAPLAFANMLLVATFTADRIFVASALPSEFGQYAFASLVVTAWLAVTAMINQAVAPQLLFEYGGGMTLRELRHRALRVAVIALVIGFGGLLLLVAVLGWLKRGPFEEFAPGLDVMPILYLGGMLTTVAFPGFILQTLRPVYSTAAAALGLAVAMLGGLALVAGDPSLKDFAWLFVGSQAVTTLVMLVGMEAVNRRPGPTAV